VWDPKSGVAMLILAGHTGRILDAQFSGDGARVATASSDKTARLWDVGWPQPSVRARLTDASVVSPDLLVAGAGLNLGAAYWNTSSPAIFTPKRAAAADKRRVVLRDAAGSVTGKIEAAGDVLSLAATPDGRLLALALDGYPLEIRRLDDGELVATLPISTADRVVISHDGRWLAAGGEDHQVTLWDTATFTLRATATHDDIISDVAFSDDDRALVSASWDHTVRVWSVSDLHETGRLPHAGTVWTARFSHDGRQLVTASEDGGLRLWTIGSNEPAVLEGHVSMTTSASFSHDDTLIVSASQDRTARVWERSSRRLLLVLPHAAPVFDAGFSLNDEQVVTQTIDGELAVWSVHREQRSPAEVKRFTSCHAELTIVDALPRPTACLH
jgi:WD40 repeat protein